MMILVMLRRVRLMTLVLLGLVPAGFAMAEATESPNASKLPAAYEVAAGDVLTVSVWNEESLQKEVLVLPDHTLSFPLVGVMNVQGLTVAQIAERLADSLSRFIPDAHVDVAVQQVRGSTVYVIGKVARPGEYPMEKQLTVLQALSMAGGLNAFADQSEIKVIRQGEKGQSALSFDYGEIAQGKRLDQNIRLMNGDVVVVP